MIFSEEDMKAIENAKDGDFITIKWMSPPVKELMEWTNDPEVKRISEEAGARMSSKYPHKCPHCGGPAYVGFSSVDCQAGCR